MYRWFTAYQGERWDINKVIQESGPGTGLSQSFKDEIGAITEQLGLKPLKGSPKKGVVDYGDIKVVINSFTFDEFARVNGNLHAYYTPVLQFDLVVMAKKVERVRRGEADTEVVYKGKMTITYEEDYPNDYPVFKLPKYRLFTGLEGQHENHMYTGGKMCLYGQHGHSERSWDREVDSAASAFGVAMRWIVWHERDRPKYGVDADDVNSGR